MTARTSSGRPGRADADGPSSDTPAQRAVTENLSREFMKLPRRHVATLVVRLACPTERGHITNPDGRINIAVETRA